jgi:hypothetical protein
VKAGCPAECGRSHPPPRNPLPRSGGRPQGWGGSGNQRELPTHKAKEQHEYRAADELKNLKAPDGGERDHSWPRVSEIAGTRCHTNAARASGAGRIIALLDRINGDADHEDGGDDEPSLAAPENVTGSQVVYMRGGDQDREEEEPETVLPEALVEPQPVAEILPWRGRGNVIAAAGVAILDMLVRQG